MVQMNSQKQTLARKPVRVAFQKTGALQYISHLDLQRTMTHAIIRADIPVWYTEGYNPKPRLNFSTPLSIGTQSHYELMDFQIVLSDNEAEMPDLAQMRDALNATLPPELMVLDVYEPTRRFTDIVYSAYTIRISESDVNSDLLEKCCRALIARPLVVMKRTKSGEKETDISPMIREMKISGEDNEIVLRVLLTASSDSFLNPEYVVTALFESGVLKPLDRTEREYSIVREDLLDGEQKHFT